MRASKSSSTPSYAAMAATGSPPSSTMRVTQRSRRATDSAANRAIRLAAVLPEGHYLAGLLASMGRGGATIPAPAASAGSVVTDNVKLGPNAYRILVHGQPIARMR